ncbi:MAG: type I methionyl aminopeptidase [Elusimicrobiota bacterium]|nr:type I methionyl aminopeptidase [Endomicrobiia bacterium]MDW8165489.1 type I methionyl aminopeptidase [Elusimicrobiota bacterium]
MNNLTIVDIKTEKEIKKIKEAAVIVSKILNIVKNKIGVGMSSFDLEEMICKYIKKFGCRPAFKGYRGYPACSCISINHELVHGVPNRKKIIKEGQIVSIDIGINYEGFYADAATTVFISSSNIENKDKILNLLNTTYNVILDVLNHIKDGVGVSQIGGYIQKYVEERGFNVIREYVGHAIGRNLHEKPDIPNFNSNQPDVVYENMVICIEPMVSMGDWRTSVLDDGWTVVMKDGSLCAHFEHMVLVKKDTAELLTSKEAIEPLIIEA